MAKKKKTPEYTLTEIAETLEKGKRLQQATHDRFERVDDNINTLSEHTDWRFTRRDEQDESGCLFSSICIVFVLGVLAVCLTDKRIDDLRDQINTLLPTEQIEEIGETNG